MLGVDFGFAGFLLREIGANPDRAPGLIVGGARAKSILAIVVLAVAAALAAALGSRTLPSALFVLLLLAALELSFAEFFLAPLRAIGRYDLETALATAGNAVQFLLAAGVAWLGGDPVAVAAAIVASRAAYLGAVSCILSRELPFRQSMGKPWRFRSTMREAWPYGVDGGLTTAWNFIDIVMVRLLFGSQAVGLYAAGQKFVQGATALAPVVGNVMVPRLARKAAIGAPDTWRTALYTGLMMSGLGLVFAIPLVAFPGWIVHVIFGPGFAELSGWLPWFGAILFIRYSGAAFGVVLSAIGLQRKRLIGQAFAIAAYGICILFVWIDRQPVEAALAAMLIAMTVMGVVYAINLCIAKKRDYVGVRRGTQNSGTYNSPYLHHDPPADNKHE